MAMHSPPNHTARAATQRTCLGLIALSALGGSCRQEGGDRAATRGGAKASLSIEYRSVSLMPTCLGHERIRIDPDGSVFRARNESECAVGMPFSTPYPERPGRTLSQKELESLAEEVRRNGFFDLPARHDTGRATADGPREEIEVSMGGRRHTVRVAGSSPPAFDQVRQAVIDRSY